MKKILLFLLKKLPLKNTIIFESHTDFSDNSRTLYEYMLSKGLDKKYKMIWLVSDMTKFKSADYKNTIFIDLEPKNLIVKIKYYYALATAKFAFYSHRGTMKLNKGEIRVNLWHGTGPKNPSFADLGTNFDYVFYSSDFFKDGFVNNLNCRTEQLLPFGSIRNDILFRDNHVLNKISNKKYAKTIMWMPTFKKNKNGHEEFDSNEIYKFGTPIVRTSEQLVTINNYLVEKNMQLIIKLHPAQDMTGIELINTSNILFLTNDVLDKHEIQLYELLSEMDTLITDVSSVYVDFLLLDRPIGFTIDDIHEYKTGYFFEDILEYMPGNHIMNMDDLMVYLDDVSNNKDKYHEDRERVNKLFNKYKDGHFAERVVEYFKI